jgi:hypothetical protein
MRMAPAGAPPGAGMLAGRETDILTTANVSRSSTGAMSGAYRSGERSTKEFVPPELRGRPVLAIPVLYVGDPEAGAAAVLPLRDLGPAVDHIGRMPYTAFQAALDLLAPWDPGGFYARGEYMPGLGDAAIDVFLAHATDLVTFSPPFSQMIFRIGQGVAAVPGEATAFSHRDARYLFHLIAAWLDPRPRREDDRCHPRVRGRHTPVQHRRLVSQLHPRGRPGPRRLRRRQVRPLVALNNSYDPANLFRLNQNIRPSQPAAEPVLA